MGRRVSISFRVSVGSQNFCSVENSDIAGFFQFFTGMKSQEEKKKKKFIKIVFLAQSLLLVKKKKVKTVSSIFWITNTSERHCKKISHRTISER